MSHEHEWVVFSTAKKDRLMVRCVECGAIGRVDDPTRAEWAEAFHAPSGPYRWTDDARVAQLPFTHDGIKINEGFICLATNPAFPNFVMIEQTLLPLEFLDGLQELCPYQDYELRHVSYVTDRFQAKSDVYAQLAAAQVRNGEWFTIGVDEAVRVIANIAEQYQV